MKQRYKMHNIPRQPYCLDLPCQSPSHFPPESYWCNPQEESGSGSLQGIPISVNIVGSPYSTINMKLCHHHESTSPVQHTGLAAQDINHPFPMRLTNGYRNNTYRCGYNPFVEQKGNLHKCPTAAVKKSYGRHCYWEPNEHFPDTAHQGKVYKLANGSLKKCQMDSALHSPYFKPAPNVIQCTPRQFNKKEVFLQLNNMQSSKKTCRKCVTKQPNNYKTKKAVLCLEDEVAKIDNEEMTSDRISMRRRSIFHKVMFQDYVNLTNYEQLDVHQRAEESVAGIIPHPDYILTSSDRQHHIKDWVENFPSNLTRKKRRRRTGDCAGDSLCTAKQGPEYKSYITLDNGVSLLRPAHKLVELVAGTINNSPDGLLQVQQVYHIIMARYPYFKYLSKDYLISWRSSIRHALYQKWFTKIEFNCEFVKSRGCYWSLNQKVTPKEWKLPERSDCDMGHLNSSGGYTECAANNIENTFINCHEQDPLSKRQQTSLKEKRKKRQRSSLLKIEGEQFEEKCEGISRSLNPVVSTAWGDCGQSQHGREGCGLRENWLDGSQGADSGYCDSYQLSCGESEVRCLEQPLDLSSPSKQSRHVNTTLPTVPKDICDYPMPPSSGLSCPLLDLTEDVEWEDPDIDTTLEYEELKEAEKLSLNFLNNVGDQMPLLETVNSDYSGAPSWEGDKNCDGMKWDSLVCEDASLDLSDSLHTDMSGLFDPLGATKTQ